MCEVSARAIARKICRDPDMTLHEKQRRWLELTELLPDERVCLNDIVFELTEETGLHDLLRAFIAEQRQLEEAFFADEPDVVYLAEYQDPETGEWRSWYYPSLSWEGCMASLGGVVERSRITVTKFFPKQFEGGFMKEITAELNEGGALTDIHTRMGPTFPAWRDLEWQIRAL